MNCPSSAPIRVRPFGNKPCVPGQGIPSGWERQVPWRGQDRGLSPRLETAGKGLAGGQGGEWCQGPASHQHLPCLHQVQQAWREQEQLLLWHLQVPWQ